MDMPHFICPIKACEFSIDSGSMILFAPQEAEAVNRGLKDICSRHGITVPPELEVTHSRRHTLSPVQRSSMSLPSSHISGSTLSEAHSTGDAAMVSRTPSETSFDSDFLERLAAARVSVHNPASSFPQSGSQPPSPVSPVTAVLHMMQQLQQVMPSNAENCNLKVNELVTSVYVLVANDVTSSSPAAFTASSA